MIGRRTPRVCLITPGHLSTNPRIVKEADALREAGYDVVVIATNYLEWARQADGDFAGRNWTVVCKPAFGPQAPLRTYLWQTARLRTATGFVKLLGLRRPIVERAVHPVTTELIRAAMSVQADLYIAHYVAALPAAARAAKRHGAAYAFDAEDFHLGEFPDESEHLLARDLIRAIESRYLPGCAYVSAASPGIADAYAKEYTIDRPTVILNVFPLAQAPPGATPKGTAEPGPSVYWFSQTIGPNRGLECAVEAIALARSRPHLYLRGVPAKGFLGTLQALADTVGVGDRLHVLAPAAPREMERLASVYDIGLAAEPGWTCNNSLAVSNKLFSYLLAGLAVVSSATSGQSSFASSWAGAAFSYQPEQPRDLASAIDALLLEPTRLQAARAKAWALAQTRFNWEYERNCLLACVQKPLNANACMTLYRSVNGSFNCREKVLF